MASIVDTASQSDREVKLHPLVLINISDHYTREKVKGGDKGRRVYGVLFGVQDGMVADVCESYEMVYTIDKATGKVDFDEKFLEGKTDQISQIFPNFEILGWYSTGPVAQPEDLLTHKAITAVNENPLYLLLNPGELSGDGETLPVSMFETQMKEKEGDINAIFVNVDYKINAGESERVAVDHVAQVTPQGVNQSAKVPHLTSLRSAIDTLVSRVDTLRNFLIATQKQNIPMNHPLLRQAAQLCNQLPLFEDALLKRELLDESKDTLLVSHLASITQCSNALSETMDKYAAAYGDGYVGRIVRNSHGQW